MTHSQKSQFLSVALFISASVFTVSHCSGANYYIDSVAGNDGNTGLSPNSAWASHTKIGSTFLSPGDVVYFKKGSAFSGPVELKSSGISNSPIRLTSYGTGELPKFTNTSANSMNGNCIRISGDYIVIENLYFHDSPPCTLFQGWNRTGGIFLNGAIVNMIGSEHNIIRANVFTNCVKAVQSSGEYTLITGNYMDGPAPEQNIEMGTGWGPIGIHLGIGNQEVSHNTIKNFRFVGGPFGSDGGAIELDDGRWHKNNFYIHHNYTEGNAGFLESSWEYDNNPYVQEVHNLRVSFNISYDGQQWLYMWAPCHNTYFDNNTVIRHNQFGCPQQNNDVALLHVQGGSAFDPAQIHFRNNLFVYDNSTAGVYQGNGAGGSIKANNWYLNYDNYSAILGGDGNKAGDGDPLVVDLANGNYNLTASSPLIGQAQNLSQYYSTDFGGAPLPTSGPWDVGAWQVLLGDLVEPYGVDLADFAMFASYWSYVRLPAENMAARWPLDENPPATIVSDDSGNGRDGTLNGDPLWQSSGGQIGGALDFDGVGDYIAIAGYKGVIGPEPRTVSAWIKTSVTGIIISWGSLDPGGKWLFRVDPTNGAIRISVQDGYIIGDTDVRDNQWHHAAAVFDNDGTPDVADVKLYVDGVEETYSGVLSQTINTVAGNDVMIGVFGSSDYFNGLIDEVHIYDRALSEGEITGENWPIADLNGDHQVNAPDLMELAENWLIGATSY